MSQTMILQSFLKKNVPLLLCLCNSASSTVFHVMADVAVLENKTLGMGCVTQLLLIMNMILL